LINDNKDKSPIIHQTPSLKNSIYDEVKAASGHKHKTTTEWCLLKMYWTSTTIVLDLLEHFPQKYNNYIKEVRGGDINSKRKKI